MEKLSEILARLVAMLRRDLRKYPDLCLNIGGVPVVWDKRGYIKIVPRHNNYKEVSEKMTYAFVVPEENMADLVLIRSITKESIRSLIRTSIHDKCQAIIAGMVMMHGKEFISNLYLEQGKAFKEKKGGL